MVHRMGTLHVQELTVRAGSCACLSTGRTRYLQISIMLCQRCTITLHATQPLWPHLFGCGWLHAGLLAGLLAAEASFKKTGSWPWKPWRFSSFQTYISAALVAVATRMMLLHPWWTPGQRLCPRSWLRISASRPPHLLQTLSRCSRAL